MLLCCLIGVRMLVLIESEVIPSMLVGLDGGEVLVGGWLCCGIDGLIL